MRHDMCVMCINVIYLSVQTRQHNSWCIETLLSANRLNSMSLKLNRGDWSTPAVALDDGAENGTEPGPVVVRDDFARVGDQWSVVGVELTRLVSGTVVVRVTDR